MGQQSNSAGRAVLAVLLIGLGVVFLIGQFVPGFRFWNVFSWIWPLFIMVPGLAMFAAVVNRNHAGLAVPASLVTGTGLILLYQSVTGHWGSWSYVWTLYAVFLGFGLWLSGRVRHEGGTMRTGVNFMLVGVAGFVFFGLLFGGFVGSWFWALLLIGAGVWMLLRSSGGQLPQGIVQAFKSPAASDESRSSTPPPPPSQVSAPPRPADEAPRDIMAETPLGKDIAAALAEEDAPKPEPAAPTAVEPTPPAENEPAPPPEDAAAKAASEVERLRAELEAAIKASAEAASAMTDRDDEPGEEEE